MVAEQDNMISEMKTHMYELETDNDMHSLKIDDLETKVKSSLICNSPS